MENLPAEENEKRCAGTKEDGSPCASYHTRDSAFCNFHGGGLVLANERRKKQAKQHQELVEEFDFGYFETKTRMQVQDLTEKVINGLIKGTIKREKGAALAMFLPFAYKIAKELEGSVRTGSVKVSITEKGQSLTMKMDEAMMDRYLSSNEVVRIQMLEQLKSEGNLKITKQKDTIDVVATDITAEKAKIPIKEFAALSKKTDVPMNEKQMLSLFGGKTLATAKDGPQGPKLGPDMVGFGEIFQKGGLPVGAIRANHKWVGRYTTPIELGGVKSMKLLFTCEYCKAESDKLKKEPCLESPLT